MRLLFIVLSDASRQVWADTLAGVANSTPQYFVGTPASAAHHLTQLNIAPSHIVLDIGMRGQDVLPEIDHHTQQNEPGTRVIAVGDTNDILLYRGLLARGVLDYL